MKPHLLDQEVIDMILRHATECIGTDGVDGLRGHILTLTALLAAIAAHDSELAAQLSKVEGERDAAEQALSQAYYLVTGKSPAWSSTFGQTELLEEIKESVNVLKASVRDSVFNNMLDRKP